MPEGFFASTCAEGSRMLKSNETEQVFFRPDGVFSATPDNDLAWIKQ